ncbi:sigma-54 interaction domain-containing protein [Alkaliphilus sp. B6464]|uniref:sigma-54 interaction domain-containing protein n=1 Tax=Alkaliphilus sp. B6464 TaxID=2731219 RepID=UPI001BAD0167|nr:sigma 54-interacting transcriptional regulator [Alkaliphilus sp. B6464]QUH19802.1 sigma 54-interacting transcriptional regulator [Alkaliphilus sp. B6464]
MNTLFSKLQFEKILDHVGEGVQVIDISGKIVFCNTFAAQLDNVCREEAIGKYILDIYPSLTEETSTILQAIKTKEPILNMQQTFLNYKGHKITTVNSSIPILDGEEILGVLEVSRDITEVKALSEKLVDLQERLYSNTGASKKTREKGMAKYTTKDLIGNSEVMLKLKHRILKAGETQSPVIVFGETGTGKELVVQSIHNASKRKDRPFVAQNCAALPASLLESILFGTVKGSFTGAEDRAGLFELANGGTLFLDEINSMPVELQAKLLRVLQEGYIRRVGDIRTRDVDVRVIAAMNIDPVEAVEKGNLRKDLFYRLNVVSIRVPHLAERKEDIQHLVKFFVRRFNYRLHKQVLGVTDEIMDIFMTYDWPGNVRELEHIIEGAMNVMDGRFIEKDDLSYHLPINQYGYQNKNIKEDLDLKGRLEKVEKQYIQEALNSSSGNITNAAKELGIPRQTLQYKKIKYNL